jgi:cyclophilin family peptidyl-prolyl cis-trans isomerase
MRRVLGIAGLAALVVLIVVLITLNSGGNKKKNASKKTTTTTTSTLPRFSPPSTAPLTAAAVAPTCPSSHESKRVVWFTKAPPNCIPPSSVWDATFQTSVGKFSAVMPAAKSYAAVNNFVFLARWNYYNGTAFHRVIESFMDQGGDPAGTGTGGLHHYPGYSFTGNTPPSSCSKTKSCYPAGSLAMANTGSPSTNGGQFFVVVGNGGQGLTPVYTLFGHVTSGMPVVEKINSYGAPSTSSAGVPRVKVYLLKVTVKEVKS